MVNHNEKGDILCEECGSAFGSITSAHLTRHKMTMRQYRKKHLVHEDQPLVALYFEGRRTRKIKL